MKLGDLFIKLGLKSQEFEQGMDKAKKSTVSFGSVVKRIGSVLGIAFGAQEIIAFGKELFRISQEAEGVRAEFQRIADESDLENLRRSVKGTVSDLELMKQSVMASNFGIPVKELGGLLEFATKRAQDTGQAVDYLVNSIVVGIGRKSPMILDNLGISAVQLNEKLGNLSIGTASVGDVAEAVGKIIVESMEKSGGIIDTVGTKTASLAAHWENFKLKIVETPALINRIKELTNIIIKELTTLEMVVSGFATWGDIIKATASNTYWDKLLADYARFVELEKTRAKYSGMYGEGESTGGPLAAGTKKQTQTIKELREEIDLLKGSIDLYNVTQGDAIQGVLQEIAAKEKLLKLLTEERKEREKQREVSAIPFTPIKATKVEQQKEYSWLDAPGVDMGLSDIELKLQQTRELTAKFQEDWMNDWGGFQAEFASLIDSLITDSIYVFAESLGQLAGGEINLNGFFNNVLNQIGNFAKQLGGMLIAFGVAKLAFGESLANFFSPVGAGALIAAGAALVAVGGAISSATRAKSGGGGGVGGTGMFNQSYNVNVAAAASPTSATLFLKGDDIYLSGQRNIYKRGAIG